MNDAEHFLPLLRDLVEAFDALNDYEREFVASLVRLTKNKKLSVLSPGQATQVRSMYAQHILHPALPAEYQKYDKAREDAVREAAKKAAYAGKPKSATVDPDSEADAKLNAALGPSKSKHPAPDEDEEPPF